MRTQHLHQPPKAALELCRLLIGFSELMRKLLRFSHSVFVKRGTDKNFLRSYLHMFLDPLF